MEMLALAWVAFLGAEVPAPSTAAAAAPSAAVGPNVTGAWRFAERDVTVALYRSAGGLLQGKVTQSPRPAEVGAWIVRDARFDPHTQTFAGHLVTSDAGKAALVVTVTSPQSLQLVGSRFFLSKTMQWTRAAQVTP